MNSPDLSYEKSCSLKAAKSSLRPTESHVNAKLTMKHQAAVWLTQAELRFRTSSTLATKLKENMLNCSANTPSFLLVAANTKRLIKLV